MISNYFKNYFYKKKLRVLEFLFLKNQSYSVDK